MDKKYFTLAHDIAEINMDPYKPTNAIVDMIDIISEFFKEESGYDFNEDLFKEIIYGYRR